jgi:hypothetical protein
MSHIVVADDCKRIPDRVLLCPDERSHGSGADLTYALPVAT